MKEPEITNDRFSVNIANAARCLRNNDCENAFKEIIEAMLLNPDAPQPHNLLGILYELQGDGNRARRHYRAAYSLDPTYRPACKNLEQICTVFDDIKQHIYTYGDEPEESAAGKNGLRSWL
ncbi:MAG: hypothetical protein QMB62_11350 [Oscillospiraceae bacterium]